MARREVYGLYRYGISIRDSRIKNVPYRNYLPKMKYGILSCLNVIGTHFKVGTDRS
jgi:hypothetical protein